jgi:UDP-N-acetylglucosamine--N-acetylmuramyl-(pentapeptide) pyrophosphoryl-undecaprenol N-acetylglucosamine transferase
VSERLPHPTAPIAAPPAPAPPAGPVVVFSGGGTGGHLYPALALADALGTLRPDMTPFFVGALRGVEAQVLPRRGVPHLLLAIEGFPRGLQGMQRVRAHLRVVGTLLRALAGLAGRLRELRPTLVVVTGGYAGGPAGILATLLGLPLVLQEQNAVPGVTTRLLSLRAREIHLAFPEARGHLPRPSRRRVRVSGNPVRPPVAVDRAAAARRFGVDPEHPVILVVGGSQGSEALYRGVLALVEAGVAGRASAEGEGAALPSASPGGGAATSHGVSAGGGRLPSPSSSPLPGGASLLWATGPSHLEGIRSALSRLGNPGWVRAEGYIEEMPEALGLAEVAVSRAGAMGTAEFLAWGVPSILVPLPTAAADHQTVNAEALARGGAALLLPEARLDAASLHDALATLLEDPRLRAGMAAAARTRGRPSAAVEIAQALERHLPRPVREGGPDE